MEHSEFVFLIKAAAVSNPVLRTYLSSEESEYERLLLIIRTIAAESMEGDTEMPFSNGFFFPQKVTTASNSPRLSEPETSESSLIAIYVRRSPVFRSSRSMHAGASPAVFFSGVV